jgi:hypothetical protein
MAERACHVPGYALQFGLTSVLGVMEPHRKRRLALETALLLIGYPLAAVALMRLVTAHLQSAWIIGSIFVVFTLLFLRLVTGIKTVKVLGRRW